MFTTLYLVRHGQTVFNTRLLIQGRCDSPAHGIWVATRHAPRLNGWETAACALMPRSRRRRSAPAPRRSCSGRGRTCGSTGLSERSFGDLEGTDVLALPRPMGDHPVAFGGEPQAELESRLSSTLGFHYARRLRCRGRDLAAGGGEVPAACRATPCRVAGDAPVEACAVEPAWRG